jgi:hypothetical protein
MDFDNFDKYMNNLPATSAPQARLPLCPDDEAYIKSMDEPLDTVKTSSCTSPPNASAAHITCKKWKRKTIKSDALWKDAIGNCMRQSNKKFRQDMTR